jgi:hypothetical protein
MSDIKVPTFDELVKTELVKFDEVIPKIEELKKEFLPLKISSIDDEEGYQEVAKALKFVIGRRTAIEDKRKELKADSLAYGRAVDSRAKEITLMLNPIEQHLREQKENVDDQIRAIEREKEEENQKILEAKHNLLVSLDMQLLGNQYINIEYGDDFTLPSINLETLPNEEWDEYIDGVRKVYEKVKQAKLIEQEKIAQEKAKFEEQQAKLKEEQDAIYQEKLQMRLEVLVSLGCQTSNVTDFVFYKQMSVITTNEIKTMTIQDWSNALNSIKDRIAKYEQNLVDEALEVERAKKQKEDEEAKLKLQMIANMKEKEKISYYAKQLLLVEKPEMTTQKWGNELKKLVAYIESYVQND